MTDAQNIVMIPEEVIIARVYLIRGKKVMLDRDLAEFYGMETRRLKEQVRRNIERFPEDFMIELTRDELVEFRRYFGNSNREIMGLRIAPFAFTEHGILMLSSILNTERAIQVNIQLVRIFIKMREIMISNIELLREIERLKVHLSDHDQKFMLVFDFLRQFEEAGRQQEEQANRKRIGYRSGDS